MTEPLSYSLKSASEATGMSKSTLDRAIKSGHLKAKRTSTNSDGDPAGSYVVLRKDLENYLQKLVDA